MAGVRAGNHHVRRAGTRQIDGLRQARTTQDQESAPQTARTPGDDHVIKTVAVEIAGTAHRATTVVGKGAAVNRDPARAQRAQLEGGQQRPLLQRFKTQAPVTAEPPPPRQTFEGRSHQRGWELHQKSHPFDKLSNLQGSFSQKSLQPMPASESILARVRMLRIATTGTGQN